MKLFKYLAANVFPYLGGAYLGLSLPLGHSVLSENPMIDFVVFFPIGILIMGISYFYKFIDK